MNTQELVRTRLKQWLEKENKSYEWLAEQLHVSKALVGHLLAGRRTFQPHHIEQTAALMNLSVSELLAREEKGKLHVQLRGELTNRRSRRELDNVIFAVEDYLNIKEQKGS
ncbi:helix-turn-helix domain-containing protein [Alkalicoccus urumqiensis]|uniref:XRE family transcriptional regulator n=1 Tax=Alkalicoccus urumqiensis TaxID=1548213 RepID=A0A2P6MJK3_ALKUR|nr:helix-turn-helix transcriptional regulator [Alkalicoccus urumqiensis]PRO66450.1 XRE family transcriptional regulator [Alkalicoccus urumqiensis]